VCEDESGLAMMMTRGGWLVRSIGNANAADVVAVGSSLTKLAQLIETESGCESVVVNSLANLEWMDLRMRSERRIAS